MTHAVLIASAPSSDLHRNAKSLCEALSQKNELSQVYFVGEAVLITQPSYAITLEGWLAIARERPVQLWVCSGSMSTQPTRDLPTEIDIVGHASWVEESQKATRILSFPA